MKSFAAVMASGVSNAQVTDVIAGLHSLALRAASEIVNPQHMPPTLNRLLRTLDSGSAEDQTLSASLKYNLRRHVQTSVQGHVGERTEARAALEKSFEQYAGPHRMLRDHYDVSEAMIRIDTELALAMERARKATELGRG